MVPFKDMDKQASEALLGLRSPSESQNSKEGNQIPEADV